VPVLGVAKSIGTHLEELSQVDSVEVDVAIDSVEEERLARNVVATASDEAEPVVVVTAHFDSPAVGMGADDNASGVAVMLELAR